MPDYLVRCLDLFEESMQERHGWRPDYAGLERELLPVRLGRRDLIYRDLETIQNGRFWDFRQFWRFPPQGDLQREIGWERLTSLVRALPIDEARAIETMHGAFKYIENVSVVLRFVHPDHYGILSPPVEKVLEVCRGRTEVETYMNYLRDLRDVCAHHGLKRAADADMALWVLQERVLSSYRDHDLLRAYREDAWLRKRKAVNLLAGLADGGDPLDLARALVEADPALAGIIAAGELERRVRARAGCPPGTPLAEAAVIAAGGAGTPGAGEAVARLRDALVARDRLFAPGSRATREGTRELIEAAAGLDPEEER